MRDMFTVRWILIDATAFVYSYNGLTVSI